MTVLQRPPVGRIETPAKTKTETRSLGSYVLVALLSIAVGVGAALGFSQIVSEPDLVAHDQVAAARGAAVGANLSALWAAGLAQSAAIKQDGLMHSRIESGQAQSAAIKQDGLMQSRIESGEAQSQAIRSAKAFKDAWTMRGEGMDDHLAELTTSGLATAEAYRNAHRK